MNFTELCHSCQWSKKYIACPLAVACHQSCIMVWLSADGTPKKQVYNITFLLLTHRYFLFLSVHLQMFPCPTFYRNYRKSCSSCLSLKSEFVQSKSIQNTWICSYIFLCFYTDSSILNFFIFIFFSESWFQGSECRSFKESLSNAISITCQKWKWHMNHSNSLMILWI